MIEYDRTHLFRDFGIVPVDLPPPPQRVRAEFSVIALFGQYLFTALMASVGLGIAVLAVISARFPLNVLFPLGAIAGFVFLILRATRNDYSWVELDGQSLRARHMYTGRIIERDIGLVREILTHVYLLRNPITIVAETWLGRVRGVRIRFDDGTVLLISRADPQMRNARELIEALLYQMSQRSDLQTEVIDFAGAPLLRRVYRTD